MKRIFFAALCAAAVLTACDPEGKGAKTINVNVTIDESNLTDIVPESYEITLTNTTGGAATIVESENGTATAAVVPGVYTVVAKAEVSESGFTYIVTGSAKDVSLLAEGENVTIKVDIVKEAQLVFKEIYYTGCTYKTGEVDDSGVESTDTYFRDQFYEIYNNSNTVAYADGLCIAETAFANYDYSSYFTFDIQDQDKYVFASHVWYIGGDGDDYPIQPGESIIIAQWATNHKDASLTKGTSPVNLSGAEFEAIEAEKTLWNGVVLTDNAAINMKTVAAAGYSPYQWLTSVGGATLVIFKPETAALRSDNFIANNNQEWVQTFQEIAIADVIDAVQCIDDETRITTLGMPAILDAGYIWCNGTYTGESIARKQSGTLENGKPKYQDTNNTTNDFELKSTPEIRRNNAGVPSWNTWIQQ